MGELQIDHRMVDLKSTHCSSVCSISQTTTIHEVSSSHVCTRQREISPRLFLVGHRMEGQPDLALHDRVKNVFSRRP